jgi:hypothetical protein
VSADPLLAAPSGHSVLEHAGRSQLRLARIAGVLYLFVGIFGGLAEGYVEPKMYVAGNAAATTANVVAHAELVRIATVADLMDATFFIFLAMVLYALLKNVRRSVAGAMVILVALAAGITCFNAVFEFEALRVATGAVDLSSLGTHGSNALVLLLLDTQHYGLLSAQIFFGLWLIPLGYLAHKSRMFPELLGILLVVGGGCYLIDLLTAFLFPGLSGHIHGYITIPSAIAEIWMVLYLLVVGVRTSDATAAADSQT